MPLEVDVPGGPALPASEVFLSRVLGRPVRWRFVVALSSESWGSEGPARLRRALLGDRCRVRARVRGGGALGPEATVVGARRVREKSLDYIEIEAEATAVGSPDPFLPRRRVHKVRNLVELFDRFAHVAEPVKALRNKLQAVIFPDAERTSIVQDGVSDWTFLFQVFHQAQLLAGTETWLPLVLVGGVDESQGTSGRWIVTPGSRRAYEEWNAVGARTIRFNDSPSADGERRFEFDALESVSRVPDYPSGTFPSAVEWRPRRAFDAGRWEAWRMMDLPRFSAGDGAMVWRIEDRLYPKGEESMAWESRVFASPPSAEIAGPEAPRPHAPWMGLGTVDETSASGPWIRVKLPGFEAGDDIVDVRVGTPYSGKDGRRGLHFVPEKGTEVLIAWTGRFDQSIVCTANARSVAAELVSPSTYLESEHLAQYAAIHVKKIADVTVDSNFKMAIKEQTSVASAKPLKIQADGADLKMTGGTVYTGRGL